MLTIKNTACNNTGELVEHTLSSANFFGFTPYEIAIKSTPAHPIHTPTYISTLTADEKKATDAALRLRIGRGQNDALVNSLFTYKLEKPRAKSTKKPLSLYMYANHGDAMGETLVIVSILNTLKKTGVSNYKLYLNSIGDNDSYTRFQQNLRAHLRTRINDIPANIRTLVLAGDLIAAYEQLARHNLHTDAPSPIDFLSDDSRQKFRKVLEHIDTMGIDYEVDTRLVGNPECRAHTLFEVRVKDSDNEYVVAHGGRYHAKNPNKTIVGARISYEQHGKTTPKTPKGATNTPFFFAHLGETARMRGLVVLGDLFDAELPVKQSITTTHIGDQMEEAKKYGAQYIIIMGHKEALDNTVMVRRVADRSQVVVPLPRLVGYLKRLKV